MFYSLASGTTRKISLAQMRSTAAGLDYIGASSDPDSSSEGFAVTTAQTVTVRATFEADCTAPGSGAVSVRVGQAAVTELRRQGSRFAFDIAAHRLGDDPWAGSVTGTISATAVTLDVRATGTIDGQLCDSGRVVLTLDRGML